MTKRAFRRRIERAAARHRRLIVEPLEARQLLAAIAKFDFDAIPAEPGPAGWTHITATNAAAGAIDPSGIGIKFTGFAPTTYTLTPTTATVPSDAVGIRNGIARAASSVNITFALTNLDPLKSYEVWVLGGNNFGSEQMQQVSVEGADGIKSFTQTIANLNLWVNSAVGDSTKTVTDYSPVNVAAPLHDDLDNNGTLDTYVIRVTVTMSFPSLIAQAAGVVIRESAQQSSFTLPAAGSPFTLLVENGNRVVKNSSGQVLTLLANAGPITISGTNAANDTLIVDLGSGNPLTGGVTFNGGTGGSDKLTITGGSQGTVTYNYANAHDGSIVLSNFGTLTYTGLEPIVNTGSATDVIFNLPAGPNVVTLDDDGPTGNTLSRLSGATFETTDFSNPSSSLTINRGNAADRVTVNALPDFSAGLTIGEAGGEFSTVTFAGAVSLAASKALSVSAATIGTTASLTTSGGGISLSAMGNITLGKVLASGGGSISLTADSDGDGSGTLTLVPEGFASWSQQQQLIATGGAAGDDFGSSIALSSDGNTAIVGADNDTVGGNIGQGSAIVLTRSGGVWTQQQQLTAIGGAAGDDFGDSVALSSDGNTAVVGAVGDRVGANANQGSVYIFTRSGGVWTQQQQLTAVGGAAGDKFGKSVALSTDGTTLIVGAWGREFADVFTRTGGLWTQQQRLTAVGGAAGDDFGSSVALSSDGNTAIVGAVSDKVGVNVDQGSAVVFTRTSGVWTAQQQLIATGGAAGDDFGVHVALSSDGNTAIVGASSDTVGTNTDQGSASVFTRTGGVWTEQQLLTAAGGAAGDDFGYSVALSSDGNTAIVGAASDAIGANTDQGSAVVFTRTNGVWTQQQQFTAISGAAGDDFGDSVALSSDGSTAIVGAPSDRVGANADQGSAYSFVRSAGSPASIAADGGHVTISAADADIQGTISSTGTVSFATQQVGRPIDLGTNTGGSLGLTDAELDRIAASVIQIGDANSGPITISADITRAAATVVDLTSSGAINLSSGAINTGGGNLRLSPGVAAAVGIAKTGNDVTVGNNGTLAFTNGSDLAIVFDGTTVDTQYQQLNVVGKVDLSGVDLVLAGTYKPAIGEKFTLVNNDGSDTVTGEFNSLPEGQVFSAMLGAMNADLQITYLGGSGNDVVLTATNVAPTLSAIADPAAIPEDAALQMIELSGISAGGTQSQSITVTATSDNPGLIPNPAVTYTSPGATGSISFQPVANQTGLALITITVKDNGGTASGSDSFTRSFTVRVTEVNDLPSGVNDSLSSVAEDSSPRTISFATLVGNDSAGPNEISQTLTITAVSQAVGGTVELSGSSVIFTPAENFNGPASFSYTLRDNGTTNGIDDFQTSTAVASFIITEVNDAPTGVNDQLANALEDSGPWSIPFTALLANDMLGPANESSQSLTITAVGDSVGGTVAINGSSVIFTPTENFNGPATFTYTLQDDGTTDGTAAPQTSTALVSFTITESNDSPSGGLDQLSSVAEDSGQRTISFDTLLGNDSTGPADESGQTLAIVGVSGAIGGSVSINATAIVFIPSDNFTGLASFTYTLQDNGTTNGTADPKTGPGTVSFLVTEANDPPSGVNDSLSSIAEDSGARTISFSTLLGNDSKGPNESSQSLTITAVGDPVGGTVAINGNNVIFTPAENYNGQASFAYTLRDNGTTNGINDFKTSTAAANFTITDVNDAPKGTNDPLGSIAEDSGSLSIPFATLLGNDTPGAANESSQSLTIISVTGIAGASVSISGADVIFVPPNNHHGSTGFIYTLRDNGTTNGLTDPKISSAVVSITITEVNDEPTGTDNVLSSIPEDSGARMISFATLLANDSPGPSNENAQSLTITAVSDAVGGSVNIVGTNVIFTPTQDYNGAASFNYTLQDNGLTSGANDFKTATAVARFTIDVVNDPPSFLKGADQAAMASPHSIPDWAAAIVTGPPTASDEAGQQPSFQVSSDNNGLFAAQPAIDPSGKLTFTPKFNVAGTAHVTVVLKDDGGTASGGVNASAPQTFDIVVTKLLAWHNDANSLDVTGEGGQPDGQIVPADALAIINYVNSFGPGAVPVGADIGQPFGFLDTSGGANDGGDDFVAPSDALAVINAINAGGGGEGEAPVAATTSNHLSMNALLNLLATDIASQPKRRRLGER